MQTYEIIGLRDIDVVANKMFDKLLQEDDTPTVVDEIRCGYKNPYVLIEILRCRAKCLEKLLQQDTTPISNKQTVRTQEQKEPYKPDPKNIRKWWTV